MSSQDSSAAQGHSEARAPEAGGGVLTADPLEELRPPESWPGAAGRKSVAPDVPSWPGARRATDPGGSWPGAAPAKPAKNTKKPAKRRSGPLDEQTLARIRSAPPAHRISRLAKGRWALVAALGWLVPFVAVSVWISLDADRRGPGLLALLVVAVGAAVHAAVVPQLRYRRHRWEVGDEAVYTQTGTLRSARRVVARADVTGAQASQGPLESLFNIATLTVSTGRGRLRITGLPQRAARDLAAQLAPPDPA